MKKIIITLLSIVMVASTLYSQASQDTYLNSVRNELNKKWPGNRTINIVYHGHSVPTGYYTNGEVHTFDAYPRMATKLMKEIYPYAVINTITTSIGGEQAINGQKRFVDDVFPMRPDVIFIDYALNDRNSDLADVRVAWEMMIDSALARGYKVVLLTPTPDTREDILSNDAPLAAHANQIRELASENNIGLVDSYQIFKDLKAGGTDLGPYMAQGNHVNKLGHELVAQAIYKWFAPVQKDSEFYFDFEEKVIEGNDSLVYSSDPSVKATLNNADIVVDDERGHVLSLDSDADYAQLSATPIDSNDYSISFWYKSNDQRAWRWVMHSEEAANRHFTCLNYEKWSTERNFCVYSKTVSGYAGSKVYLQDDQWHHIVFVANSGTAYLFVDGLQKPGVSFDLSGYSYSNFFFGNTGNTSAHFRMDDVYFFRSALGLSDVTEIYNEQKDKSTQTAELKASINCPFQVDTANGIITIEALANTDLIGSEFAIYTMDGKQLHSKIICENITNVNSFTPTSGVYILTLNYKAENKVYSKKFIIE